MQQHLTEMKFLTIEEFYQEQGRIKAHKRYIARRKGEKKEKYQRLPGTK